jgi:TolB-like protein
LIAKNNPVHFVVHRGPAAVDIRDSPLPIPESVCRAHFEKVAASVTFGRAEQLRRLLTWLAERSLAACPIAPSEREIAVGVLRRNDFDPQTDSLVRKEMGRLREKLARYYLSEGSGDEIHLGTGAGYLLSFERRGNVHPGGRKACWLVLPFRSNPEMAEPSEQFLEEVLIGLGKPKEREVVAPTTALAYRGRMGDVRQFAAECGADFVVEGSLRRRNESIEVTAWLIDGHSGRARRFKRIGGPDAADLARQTIAWLLEEEPAE